MPREPEQKISREGWQDAVLRLEEEGAKLANTVEEIRQTVDFLEQKLNAVTAQLKNVQLILERKDAETQEFRRKLKRLQ